MLATLKKQKASTLIQLAAIPVLASSFMTKDKEKAKKRRKVALIVFLAGWGLQLVTRNKK